VPAWNTINAEFYSVGFTGDSLGTEAKIRILQMNNFDDEKNTIGLVTDEVRE
jgi:hypothetical protein